MFTQHKWMVTQPIELKHPTFNLTNNSIENLLRIWIYEQILVTGHLDAHPDAHSNHVFLTDNIFLGYILGQTEVKLKILAHGFCVE